MIAVVCHLVRENFILKILYQAKRQISANEMRTNDTLTRLGNLTTSPSTSNYGAGTTQDERNFMSRLRSRETGIGKEMKQDIQNQYVK